MPSSPDHRWTIRKKRPIPFDSEPASIVGPSTEPVVVQPCVVAERLAEALREARPYVFNQTQGDDWRAETARDVLERVDAALAEGTPDAS